MTFFRRQGGHRSFVHATVVMEIWQDGTRMAWGHVFVEQLFLIPKGKKALESWLGRKMDEDEIKQVYKSILIQAQPDWEFQDNESLSDLWGSIMGHHNDPAYLKTSLLDTNDCPTKEQQLRKSRSFLYVYSQ